MFYDCLIGRGIFLTESRPKNAFVVEYYGELVDAEEGMRREESSDSVFRYFFDHRRKQYWCVDYLSDL